ncbi:MAG TPA: metallophosphoesterase [Nevskiaceae bacterium]|nr:metallophosphoesterase [Nevskiaceae bacterium]
MRTRWLAIVVALLCAVCFGAEDRVRFAVIGDYGSDDDSEKAVAKLVKGWQPDFIITVGDNSYVDRAKDKSGFQRGVVDYFGEFIKSPADDPNGEKTRFFPTLGNHDYESDGSGVNAERVLEYQKTFAVPNSPGGVHYYDFAKGPVHFFALDSNRNAAWSGSDTFSKQFAWWQKAMAGAKERWKIVYFHHAPYDSGMMHRRDTQMRAWDFEHAGVSAVIAGHEHVYERFDIGGIPFFTTGIGGRHLHAFRWPYLKGSQMRYPQRGEATPEDKRFGAMLVEATPQAITFEEWNVAPRLIDRWPPGADPIKMLPPPTPPAP